MRGSMLEGHFKTHLHCEYKHEAPASELVLGGLTRWRFELVSVLKCPLILAQQMPNPADALTRGALDRLGDDL